ncbi:MAG: tRNA pseudouridine(55) synthase TruB [Vicinamibacterales bacterium]
MNGVLVIDKPQGLTSHDVVTAARRALGERRIGHTGTLDPLATGVLPLAIGRATRLVRFLAASDKDYDATIRFGLTTDTYDITGAEVSRTNGTPSQDDLMRAVQTLTGEYRQVPPAYSAKKVHGRRAYRLARDEQVVALAPVAVHVWRADLIDFSGVRVRMAITCSAGFYVRSFAHTLGELAGPGACLEALRRTRSGEFRLEAAIPLEELGDAARVAARLIRPSELLSHLPAVTVTDRGCEQVSHGREIESSDYEPVELPSVPFPLSRNPEPRTQNPEPGTGNQEPGTRIPDPESRIPVSSVSWVRLLDASGRLVGMGTPGHRPGSLHPSLVLV